MDILGLIAFYGTFAGMINGVLQGIVVPVGTPIIQVLFQKWPAGIKRLNEWSVM